jgi:hypothetical protein
MWTEPPIARQPAVPWTISQIGCPGTDERPARSSALVPHRALLALQLRELPLKPGKAGTMTHDYLRHGITTLFAALNVLDGTVLGRCMQRHGHQEFLRFLKRSSARCRPAR